VPALAFLGHKLRQESKGVSLDRRLREVAEALPQVSEGLAEPQLRRLWWRLRRQGKEVRALCQGDSRTAEAVVTLLRVLIQRVGRDLPPAEAQWTARCIGELGAVDPMHFLALEAGDPDALSQVGIGAGARGAAGAAGGAAGGGGAGGAASKLPPSASGMPAVVMRLLAGIERSDGSGLRVRQELGPACMARALIQAHLARALCVAEASDRQPLLAYSVHKLLGLINSQLEKLSTRPERRPAPNATTRTRSREQAIMRDFVGASGPVQESVYNIPRDLRLFFGNAELLLTIEPFYASDFEVADLWRPSHRGSGDTVRSHEGARHADARYVPLWPRCPHTGSRSN